MEDSKLVSDFESYLDDHRLYFFVVFYAAIEEVFVYVSSGPFSCKFTVCSNVKLC